MCFTTFRITRGTGQRKFCGSNCQNRYRYHEEIHSMGNYSNSIYPAEYLQAKLERLDDDDLSKVIDFYNRRS